MRERFKEKLFTISNFFENTTVFMAVRQGLIMMIPLILAGSISLMLMSLPIATYQNILPGILNGKLLEVLEFIYAGTFKVFSVPMTVATSVSYTMLNHNNKLEREVISDCFIVSIINLITFMGYIGVQFDDFSVQQLGTANTFMAIFIALLGSFMYFKIKKLKIFQLKRPETDVDGIYYNAISSIVPAIIVVVTFAFIDQLFKVIFNVDSIQQGLEIVIKKFLNILDSGIIEGIVILLLIHIMWFFGLHGSNILDSTMQQKYSAICSTEIYNKTFQDVFTILGGCGAVLGLVIAIILFSRKRVIKNIAKMAFPTVIFNISELIIFGLPIIFNPIFFIPYVIAPVVNFIISYGAIYSGLVPHVIQKVEWTSPIFLSGYQATGSIRGSILQLVCLIIDVLIYIPYVRLFEEHSDMQMKKQVQMLVKELQAEEDTNKITVLTARDDILGGVARRMAYDLKAAIEKNELFLVFQPQVNCNEKCIGAEALIRWVHPIVGFVYPPLIICLAKEMDMLSELEKYLFDAASNAISDIDKQIKEPFKISVNITNESLMWDDFEDNITKCIEKYHINRDKLWLEITEQDALSSSIDISNKLENLKKKGHKFLIDDFGMGHTSLLYLQTNHFEIVKLDGSLTKDIIDNDINGDIIKSIVYLGRSLNFKTIAEYVETKEQMEKLKEYGVDAFQGYYYSKPIKLDELIEWMKAHC